MLYDSHIHSFNSPDSTQSLDEICQAAIRNGLTGITITDHAHLLFMEDLDILNRIRGSIADTRAAAEQYAGQLEVFCGVEMGEPHRAPEAAAQVMALTDFDVVLGSIHWVKDCPFHKQYAKIIFDDSISDNQIGDYLALYYKDLHELAATGDFDVLSHLTCPLRYINSRYERGIDPMNFRDEIAEILKIIIRRNIALEVNTPSMVKYGSIPERPILELYKDLGGRLLTLGSDNHRDRWPGKHFPETLELLRSLGFAHYHHYRARTPVDTPIT